MKEFKVLPMIWDEFLKQLCVECELNREQPETFLVRFADENAKKDEQEIAAILKISIETYKKRIGGVYKKLAKRYPQIKNIHHKFEPLHSLLKKEYKQLVEQDTEAFATNEIAPPDWYKICREMLESQKRSIRRQATEIVSEPFYVQLGLVERKHQPRRSGDLSFSPEQGSGFFQLDKEEIIKRYEHNEFLEQVIKQGQSKKSQGKRIAIIGEPGAGKTTLYPRKVTEAKLSLDSAWLRTQ
jgi:ATPase subunit of ABC transporter with duplicated ATPase domains